MTAGRAYAGIVGLASVVLLVLARDMGFRGDDWELVANRALGNPAGLLRPFNEQWILVPAVVFRLVFAVVGLHSYLPYLVVLLAIHVAGAEAVRRLVGSVSGDVAGYLAAVVVLFLGSGAENLRWAFQIGMVLSAATGLWAIRAIATDRPGWVPAALLTLSLASHAVGAVFLAGCLVLAVMRTRSMLPWLLIPCAALAVWLLAFDLPAMSARSGSLSAGVVAIPAFVVGGLATATGAVFGLSTVAGIVIAAGVAALVVVVRRRPARADLVVTALVILVAEYGLVALSRSEFGIASVTWSRYLYVAVPILLVGVAAWFGRPTASDAATRRLWVAVAGLATVAVAGNMLYYVRGRDAELVYIHRSRAVVAVASWSVDVHRPASDAQIPDPAALRALVAAHGDPTRDAYLPFVVPPVPSEIARAVCLAMLDDPEEAPACEAAVAATVGAR